jgi:hypothetical protein
MAGNNGSTKFTAPIAVEGGAVGPATGGGEPRQGPGTVEGEHRSRGEEEAPQQPRSMDSQRACNDLKTPRGMLDRSLQAQLGRQLRAIFSHIANEPVPERFLKLLEALEAREKRR